MPLATATAKMVEKAIGLLLKERRTTLDWSLDKAEKQTSIKKIYISALETENHAVFPGSFYVRAYLKQYANKLELDTEAILDAYDNKTLVEVDGPFEDTGNYRFIRPDQRIPLPSEEVEDDEDEEYRPGKFQSYLPIISLSVVAIFILLAVGLIVFFNYPDTTEISKDSYSLSTSSSSSISSTSSSSTSTGTSEEKTSLTLSPEGSSLLVETNVDPLQFDFELEPSATEAAITLTGANGVNQTVNLSSLQKSASLLLETEASTAILTASDLKALKITINGEKLDLSSAPLFSNTLGLEITYKK